MQGFAESHPGGRVSIKKSKKTALFPSIMKEILQAFSVNKSAIEDAVKGVRGNKQVTSMSAENTSDYR